MTQCFQSVHWEKMESFRLEKLGQILVPPVTQLLGSKWLKYFSRCIERKIELFWPKKLGKILVPPVTQLLGSEWLNFSLGALSKKIESFWPKKLGRILIPPVTQLFKSKWLNFLSQNDSIFSLCALREKSESFWPKKLSHLNWVETITFKLKKKNIHWIVYPKGNGRSSIIVI